MAGDARERPIIFSAPMVRAILDGRKTQTRRILKPQPPEWTANVIDISKPCFDDEMDAWGQVEIIWSRPSLDMPFGEPQREEWRPLKGLPWRPGDRAWVRETWRVASWDEDCLLGVEYAATPGAVTADRQPSESSDAERIVERLADDCRMRGAPLVGGHFDLSDHPIPWRSPIHMPRWASRITLLVENVRVQRLQDISEEDARAEGWPNEPGAPLRDAYPIGWFANLWGDIHGLDAWDRNEWVVALTFRRIEGDPHG